MEKDISVKLLICYHKPDVLFKDNILTPIHVGRAQAKNNKNIQWLTENMIGDDTGDNISNKNYCYNELTATYWAWKNYDKLGNPDYVGLMHYRRHFIFDPKLDMGVVDFEGMGENYLESINYSEENVKRILEGNDIVYYKGKVDNIYKHYSQNHKLKDLDLTLDLIKELKPDYHKYATEYVNGDSGCFCNMVIMTKAMFFEYCEFLFDILDAVFNKIDMSEKRFFISERLTGIFVYRKVKEGAKVKSLASSFVKSIYNIPVAMPYDAQNKLKTAISIKSFIENARQNTRIDFYLLTDASVSEQEKQSLCSLAKDDRFTINFVDTQNIFDKYKLSKIKNKADYYPLILAELLPTIGKCFYATNNVLIMNDIEEFFRTCSVDDYWIVGAKKKDNSEIYYKSSFMINLSRFRQHDVCRLTMEQLKNKKSFNEILTSVCYDQIGEYADWFYVAADESSLLKNSIGANRWQLQQDALWHPMICFEPEADPYINIQGVYSIFWWNMFEKVPASVIYDYKYDKNTKEALCEDQKLINTLKHEKRNDVSESSQYSMVEKMKIYYKNFGLKQTIKRIFYKIFKEKRNKNG